MLCFAGSPCWLSFKPLWKRNTKELKYEFIDSCFKAVVVFVNAALLDISFAVKVIDEDFISDLSSDIDPYEENR